MSTWRRGYRKYILGNLRKVVCPILNFPIKSNRHFQWLLSYFHGHLTWVCCWHDFMMSLFTGSAIWLTNKLRKWTEMYYLKMCLRNVRHPSRTRRFWYHIRVIVYSFSPGMQMCCHRLTYKYPRWRLRPEIVNIPLGITYLRNSSGNTYIFGGTQSKGRLSDTDR